MLLKLFIVLLFQFFIVLFQFFVFIFQMLYFNLENLLRLKFLFALLMRPFMNKGLGDNFLVGGLGDGVFSA